MTDPGVRHVVALSGGKDSTAMALRLMEVEPRDYVFLITPTGNELPEVVLHWRRLSQLLGRPLTPVTRGDSLQGLIRKSRTLPNHRMRWCTRELKLAPFYAWMRAHAPCVSYVGLRADEEARQGMAFPEEAGITVRFPMREWGWTIGHVVSYLARRGIEIPRRTDCAMCFWQRLGEWFELWRDHPDLYAEAEALEALVSQARGKPYTFRHKSQDTWPVALADLRRAFEAGRVPTNSLKRIADDRAMWGVCRACSL